MSTDLVFDRAPSAALVDIFRAGPASALVARRHAHPLLLDVQFRHNPKSGVSWGTLYAGLTSMIDVRERGGHFWLTSAAKYQQLAGFDDSWSARHTAGQLATIWPDVDRYLDRLQPQVPPRYTSREGAVQTAMTSGASSAYWAIDREAQPHFSSAAEQVRRLDEISAPLKAALADTRFTHPWWPGVRDHGKFSATGSGLDLLAVDRGGRLLAIEIKDAANLKGIVFGPVQVRVYAELVAAWIAQDAAAAVLMLNGMLDLRVSLGLSQPCAPRLTEDVIVVPVVAVGAGRHSPELTSRLAMTSRAIAGVPRHALVQDMDIWYLDERGVETAAAATATSAAPSGRSPKRSPA